MIAKITLENFFSFGKATEIILNPDLNLLVGINGSGKSNFLKAIKLLKESIVGDGFEKTFLKDWGGFSSVANYSNKQSDFIKLSFEFDKNAIQNLIEEQGYKFTTNPVYELTIFKSGSTGYYLGEKIWSIDNRKGQSQFIYLEMENSHGRISTREGGKIVFQNYNWNSGQMSFKSSESVLQQVSDPIRYYPLFTLKRAIEEFFAYEYFDTTLKSPIRLPSNYDNERQLMADGSNLVTILMRIKNHHPLEYEKLELFIQKINPNVKDISFDFLGAKHLLVLREKHLSKSVSIEHISDGTLRFLIFLAIFFNPRRGNMICIDEPETGLHPDMINSISEMLKLAANEGTQIIIATHSPLLLNAFELDQIFVFEKDETNQTFITQKKEEDFEDWNESFLVGQLWMKGLIGGKRW